MTPEIENYLSQARALGKSNEVIRQELLSAGWNEADINQPLGLSAEVPATPNLSAPAKIASGLNLKLISLGALGLVIIAVGSYFAFFKPVPQNTLPFSQLQTNQSVQNNTNNQNPNNPLPPGQAQGSGNPTGNPVSPGPDQTPPVNNSSLLPFKCKDLVADSDVKSLLNDNSIVPNWADTGAIQDFSGNIRLSCAIINQNIIPSGLTANGINIALVVIKNISDYQSQLTPVSNMMEKDKVLTGVGFQSVQKDDGTGLGEVDFISSNKKYFVVSGIGFSITKKAGSQAEQDQLLKDKQAAREKASADLAKVIDMNLNKY